MRLALLIPLALAVATAPAAAVATVVVVAPHPDDAEASCGGLIANTAASGERVVILTMTGGELGVWRNGPEEARAIRAEEARRAAAVLGAEVEFLGAVDGALVSDGATAAKLSELLKQQRPGVVVAPWPLDVHPDHQAAGQLAWRAYLQSGSTFELYFYETANGPHTTSFRFVPTDYVDVGDAMAKKREATLRHRSQDPAAWFDLYEALARVRGMEADVALAEGYLRARASSGLGGRPGRTPRTLPGPSLAPAAAQDWGGLARFREENAGLGRPRPGERRVVFLGDSITEGWIRTAPSFFAGRPWVDRGIGGQVTAQMLLRFRQDVIELAPAVVVILAGTNDVAENAGPYSEDATVGNLASMAELAREHGIRVVLASALPVFDYPWRPGLAPAPKIAALNARLRQYARRNGLVWADLFSAMADERGGLRAGLGDDGVHPNAAGYAVMGPLAEAAVARALAAK